MFQLQDAYTLITQAVNKLDSLADDNIQPHADNAANIALNLRDTFTEIQRTIPELNTKT